MICNICLQTGCHVNHILLHDVLLVKYFMEVHLLSWSTEFEFVSFL
jgi:hypothetical protein